MNNKKRTTLNHYKKGSSKIKIFMQILYILFAIMSIMAHNIQDLGHLLLEISIYTGLGFGINILTDDLSIKEIKAIFE